jgi:hypothetical protein
MALENVSGGYRWPGESTVYPTKKRAEMAKSAVKSGTAAHTVRWPARKGTERKKA